MQLVADRFVAIGSDCAIDLATGESVCLVVTSAGGATEQTQWAIRCDTLHKLHHRAIAALVDYGGLRQTMRFEAWRCGPLWRGAADERERIANQASVFLRACHLSIDRDMARLVHQCGPRPIVCPGNGTGYAIATASSSDERVFDTIDVCGLERFERPAVAAIAELFDRAPARGPQVVALWGPQGSGKTTAIRELARHGRLKGYVPVSIRMLHSTAADALNGRTLFLIDDEAANGWRSFVDLCIRAPKAHVLLVSAREDVPGVVGLPLDKVSGEVMMASVRPSRVDTRVADRVRRAIARSDGVPGRFIRALWGDESQESPIRNPTSFAAERAPAYGCEESPNAAAQKPSAEWPVPGELAGLRRRLETGLEYLRSGRHAPGDRAVRQAVGGLARRAEWQTATRGAIALAGSLVKRGRTRDGQATLDLAREYAHRGGDEAALIDIAVLAGTGWTDLARFDEAEAVLGGAVAASRAAHDFGRGAAAAGALARALFWRGAYTDAERVVEPFLNEVHSRRLHIRLQAIAARVALGRHDFTKAATCASTAVESAKHLGDHALVAEARSAAAFVHLAIGDVGNAERDSSACIAAARAARDPLRALCGRLMLVECMRRKGLRSETVDVLQRFKRKAASALPPIVRARWQLQCALSSLSSSASGSASSAADIAASHAATTGIGALRLFAPFAGTDRVVAGVVEDVVDILHLCHTAEEESAVLKAVCVRLQRQLRAVSIAFFAAGTAEPSLITSEGGRIEPAIAARAAASSIAIAPHRCEERIEAAAPVRYGGRIIGVIAARWTLGASPDVARTGMVLTMAAAAAAPSLSAVLARRARSAATPGIDLVGISAAIVDVRRAIERAATAPFAVMIEGESGCGKELVARAVHRDSSRRDRPICTLNCAALPDDLVESELFGHARGAFTGAVAERTGVFEEAHSGTLFLDEVGELSPRAQAKVLRVIQEGELRRIGENVSRRVDVRIVSATNRNLQQEVAAGRFRLDLLYRLDVIRVTIPPLRDRREDIAVLVDHFWREATSRVGSRATLSTATTAALARYDWPGNVRELQNVLAALAVRAGKRGVVPPTALPPQFGAPAASDSSRLEDARRRFEERFVRAALVRTGGRRAEAAAELGVTRQGLTKLMTRLGISAE